MKNQQDNLGSQDGKIDLKMWMEEHPQEYGEFAAAMGEADSLEVFLLGAAAFLSSPEFQKRLENMINLDNLDLDELLKILQESDFAEKIFGEQAEGSEWAKYRLPFAAWLKYGRSSEMMIDNIEEAAESIDNKQYQWQLAKFMKTFLAREVEDKRRSRKDLKEHHWRLLKSVNAKLLNSVFMLVTRFSGLQTLSHFSNDYIGVGALKLGSPIFHECRTIHFQPDC